MVNEKIVKPEEYKGISSSNIIDKTMFPRPDAWYNFCFRSDCIGDKIRFYACWCCYRDDKCFESVTDCKNHCGA